MEEAEIRALIARSRRANPLVTTVGRFVVDGRTYSPSSLPKVSPLPPPHLESELDLELEELADHLWPAWTLCDLEAEAARRGKLLALELLTGPGRRSAQTVRLVLRATGFVKVWNACPSGRWPIGGNRDVAIFADSELSDSQRYVVARARSRRPRRKS